MKTYARRGSTFVLGLALVAGGCQKLVDSYVGVKPPDAKVFTITMVAKASTNPVFLSARAGAEAAARDLSQKYGKIEVRIDWRTPKTDDARGQAERIRAAVNDGTDAILVSCSDEQVLTAAIDEAVDHGVPVMTFDSDAAGSKRFAFYGPNDEAIGESVMDELAALVGQHGKIAILGGNAGAPNLRRRVAGVKKAAAKYPGIELVGAYFHAETAEDATAEVLRAGREHPDLAGWAMVGGWPLFGSGLLAVVDPAKLKIVAVDALPVQLVYVEKGVVPVLLAQPTFRWGKVSVETIVDKLYRKKEVQAFHEMKLIRVSKANLAGWARQLRAWGYEDVPRKYLTYEPD